MSFFDRFRRAPQKKESASWPAIISGYGAGSYVWKPRDYAALAKEGYQNVAAVYGCVSLIARAAGGIDWYVMDGENEVEGHELEKLLARPNEFDSRASFIEKVVSFLLLSGNSYIERVQGIATAPPKYLYALRPDRMTPKAGIGPREYISAWEYNANGRLYTYKPEQILHIAKFHPTNDFFGLSPLEVAAKSIDIANLSLEWNANTLNRSMQTPGALKILGQLTEDQRKVLLADLATYQGAGNAGKIPIFEGGTGGMEWMSMAITPKDMEWQESDRANLRRICAIFNVWSGLFGDTENQTYANYQEGRAGLYTEAVLPVMDILRDELNNWLSWLYGPKIRLEYDRDAIEAIQEDRGKKYAYLNQADWLTVNEKREATGYDDVGPDGDVILVQISKMPLDQAIAEPEPVPDALAPFAGTEGQAKPDEEDVPGEDLPVDEEAEKPKKSAPAHEVKAVKDSFWHDPERKSLLWKAFDRRLAMQERQLVPLVKKYLREQADRVKARMVEGIPAVGLVNVEAEAKAYAERFFPFYERAFRLAGQAGFHATQGKFYDPTEDVKAEGDKFVVNPEQLAKLRAQIAKSAHLFNETTGKFVQSFVEDAAIENLTTEQVTQELWKALGDRAAWEARRIAATEMTRTDGWGAHEGYKQNDAIDAQGWNCQMLDTSRDSHMEMDGVEVGIDENFVLDGWEFRGPSDPVSDAAPAGLIVNCRCSTFPIVGGLGG
jgi:HK97 family phage portal protein